MIKYTPSEEIEVLRSEFRKWLRLNATQKKSVTKKTDTSLKTFENTGRQWQKKLAASNWIGVHWPKEFGGRGLTLAAEAVLQEELVAVHAPQVLGLFGLTMVGPVLIQHGTSEQKKRYLSKILSADEIWCQGFSEPGAGSDLAAIKTKGESTTGGYRVSGQKIWTSFAHIADFCFVLCRTHSTGKPHEGLTYLLIDMKTPGITTRPLKQISGDEEFNEVFFDDVFVPESQVVGKAGDGWKIALSTLMYERVVLTFARQLQSETALREIIEQAKSFDESGQVAIGKEIVRSCAVRALAYDHLVAYADGRSPGPEGSLDKLFWSESFQSIAKLSLSMQGYKGARNESDPNADESIHRYLYSRGRTIAAGTSEIQRNIIAERLLGLPKAKIAL